MTKAYKRINWKNYPSVDTPLNEQNLNTVDRATDTIDDRVISLDTTKFDKTEAAGLIKSVTFDEKTGVFTFQKYDGSNLTIDTKLEKLAVNFTFDPETQKLTITLEDGTTQEVDLTAFLTQYEFTDSETIAFSQEAEGKVSAKVKEGSINEKHLRPDYLADVKVEREKAEQAASSAQQSQEKAAESEKSALASSQAAAESEQAAKDAEDAAREHATVAEEAEAAADAAADMAAESAQDAQESKDAAQKSAELADTKATEASTSADNAAASEGKAAESQKQSEHWAKLSESYAHGQTEEREGEETDNAKYYFEHCKSLANASGNVLIPMGDATFEELSDDEKHQGGYLYNVTEDFTTDESFLEGAGHKYYSGTNVYWYAGLDGAGHWDVLQGANDAYEERIAGLEEDVANLGKMLLERHAFFGIETSDGSIITTDGDGVICADFQF